MADSLMLKGIKTTGCGNSCNCITCCLPMDILVEITAKVASHSLADLYHLKVTSKEMMNITDDDYVYKHASLDQVPFFLNPEIPEHAPFLSILSRCRSSGNLESLYREGKEAYFWDSNRYEEGLDIIRMAAQKGHEKSMYAFAMIVLMMRSNNTRIGFLGAEELEEALGYLRFLRNQKCVLKCRNDVGGFVSKFRCTMSSGVNVQVPTKRLCEKVPCKNTWRLKIGSWSFMTEEDDENDPNMCENCRWDHELEGFCAKILDIDVLDLLYG